MRKPFLAVVIAGLSLLFYFLLPESISEGGRRVYAIVLFAIFFWGLEIIPLFATSLVIVALLTFLLLTPFPIIEGGYYGFDLFLIPFSNPVVILFLGGLVLAATAAKHNVDQLLMQKMLGKIGTRPVPFLLGILGISAFFSLWISNTATAAMMVLLLKPILDQLDEKEPLRKALPLAAAFGASLGGISTPIGSPPNAVAVGILREHQISLSFLTWMKMTLPLVLILLSFTGLVLYLFFRPKVDKVPFPHEEVPKLTKEGKGVIAIALIMILLWLTKPLHKIPEEIVALLGVALFTSFRLLQVKEFRQIPWDILVLIWGGLALGEAFEKTGLIDETLQLLDFQKSNFFLIAFFSFLAVILTSFINNTATANLLLPIAMSIDPTAQNFLPIAVALACSFALALPVSTPPNAMLYSSGTIELRDMFKTGTIISIFALLVMLAGFQIVVPYFFGT